MTESSVFVYLESETEVQVVAARESAIQAVAGGGTFPLSLIAALAFLPVLVRHRETLALYVVYGSVSIPGATSFRAMRVHDEMAGRMVLDLGIPADITAWPAG